MKNILGISLDIGSLGLAYRMDNEIQWATGVAFDKGVGLSPLGEYSVTSKRTTQRGIRNNAKVYKYRRSETLKVLIENGYCPLKMEELKAWNRYEKDSDNSRVYPINNKEFQNWIHLDFNNDGTPEFSSPYQLRYLIAKGKLSLDNQVDRMMIGRALFHISQRRGFKSSRASGDTEKTSVYSGGEGIIGVNEYSELIASEGTLGAALAVLELSGQRIRNRYTLRSHYLAEVDYILGKQNCSTEFKEAIIKAIFKQLPIKGNKKGVGKCSLELEKSRIPVSHPQYELYSAWSFLNNIKYRIQNTGRFLPLPLELKREILINRFYLKSNKNFKFKDIRKFIMANGGKEWELNYSKEMDDSIIASSYVSAQFKAALGEDWANWKHKQYGIEQLWNILNSFDDEENIIEILHTNFGFNDETVKVLLNLWNTWPKGYGSLSQKAIRNTLVFLEKGITSSLAMMLAKIPELVQPKFIDAAIEEGISIMDNYKFNNECIEITNILIDQYYDLEVENRFAHSQYKLDKSDYLAIDKAAKSYYKESVYAGISTQEKEKITGVVAEYLEAFYRNPLRGRYSTNGLYAQLKEMLQTKFGVSPKTASRLYQPSQTELYPKKENQQLLGSPKNKAFANPVVYKTLYALKTQLNKLLESGKISTDTELVINMNRSLNDANMREAIKGFQRQRMNQNAEITSVLEVLSKNNSTISPTNSQDIEKFRLWLELTDKNEALLKETSKMDGKAKIDFLLKEKATCFLSGEEILVTDVFNSSKVTRTNLIPRTKAFDNEMHNKTICPVKYAKDVKGDLLAGHLPNSSDDAFGYSGIKNRVGLIISRINVLDKQIDMLNYRIKITDSKAAKDKAIKDRHILKFQLQYWDKKLVLLTSDKKPKSFIANDRNASATLTRYALHYLKTVFPKVNVEKEESISDFMSIYNVEVSKETELLETRNVIRAVLLTLIPKGEQRKEIIKKMHEWEEERLIPYREDAFKGYSNELFKKIERTALVQKNVKTDNVITPTMRKVGKPINGVQRYNTGMTIRGELHKETFYGKIQLPSASKNAEAEYRFVVRKSIAQVKLEEIVSDDVRKMIEKQIGKLEIADYLAKNGPLFYLNPKGEQVNQIRHVRCFSSYVNLTELKKQSHLSKHSYKQSYYVNSGSNYAFGFYASKESDQTLMVSKNLMSVSSVLRANKEVNQKNLISKLFEPTLVNTKKGISETYDLQRVFKLGQRVLFFNENKEELKKCNLYERLYTVKVLMDAASSQIQFEHHAESRSEKLLEAFYPKEKYGVSGYKGFGGFQKDIVAPKIRLRIQKENKFISEGEDFEITPDGKITWLF